MNIPTIACVLRSGGDFLPEHVERMADMLQKHVRGAYHFACLSDYVWETPNVDIRPLRHSWPGWWSKMELFREFPRGAFYLDLDTTITGDISSMIQPVAGFWGLQDFGDTRFARGRIAQRQMGSGVMHWGAGFRTLYESFSMDPEWQMQHHTTPASWGDQGFIQRMIHAEIRYLQDRWPGQIRSYKWDVMPYGMTPDTRIVCFHGKPRPWQIDWRF